MGIKLDPETKLFSVSYGKRHPITRQAVTLRRKGVKTKAEAQRVYRELVVLVERKLHKAIVPTWSELLSEIDSSSLERGWSEKTRHNFSTCLTAHTLDWSDRLVDQIKSGEIVEHLNRSTRERAEQYRKLVFRYSRQAFQFAFERGYVSRNPVPNIRFKSPEKIRSVLTEPQAKQLLQKAQILDWAWYPHYALAIYTGMRNGELFALTWDKVDLESRKILVNQSWNNKDGFKSTKSGDDRVVEIAEAILPLLKELKLKSEHKEFVLGNRERWIRGRQAHDLRLFCQGQDLPKIRFHDLRATWATLMLSKGVEPIKVMKMGGWKDIETMMIYARKAGVDIKGITDCLNGLHIHGQTTAKVLEMGVRL